jgi:hypothetical protein
MRSPPSGTPSQTSPQHRRITGVCHSVSRARASTHTGGHLYVAVPRLWPVTPLTVAQDISARSPIQDCGIETYPRQSLDARRSVDTRRSLDVRRSRATPRSSMQQHRESTDQPAVPEEGFEDVGLNDEPRPLPQKKRGLFSRFGDNNHADDKKTEERPTSSHHFSLTGRKRAESGTGSELKPMSRPSTEIPVVTRS